MPGKTCPLMSHVDSQADELGLAEVYCNDEECAWWYNTGPFRGCVIMVLCHNLERIAGGLKQWRRSQS
jgi:hypothetical protein